MTSEELAGLERAGIQVVAGERLAEVDLPILLVEDEDVPGQGKISGKYFQFVIVTFCS